MGIRSDQHDPGFDCEWNPAGVRRDDSQIVGVRHVYRLARSLLDGSAALIYPALVNAIYLCRALGAVCPQAFEEYGLGDCGGGHYHSPIFLPIHPPAVPITAATPIA